MKINNTNILKTCSKATCIHKKEQPISNFHKNKQQSTGLHPSCKDCVRKLREENKVKYALTRKNWRLLNPEYDKNRDRKEYLKEYENSKRNRPSSHNEYQKEYQYEWRKKNAGLVASYTAAYRAAKDDRTPKWLTDQDKEVMRNIYKIAHKMSQEQNIKYEVDHIIPLRGKKVSGLHVPSNLQIITEAENQSKGNKYQLNS